MSVIIKLNFLTQFNWLKITYSKNNMLLQNKTVVILTGILSGCLARTLSPSALLTSSDTERWYWLLIWKQHKETNDTIKHQVPHNRIIYQVDKGQRGLADFTNIQYIQSTSDTDGLKSTSLFVTRRLLIKCFVEAVQY